MKNQINNILILSLTLDIMLQYIHSNTFLDQWQIRHQNTLYRLNMVILSGFGYLIVLNINFFGFYQHVIII